jgi:hypothetical protein
MLDEVFKFTLESMIFQNFPNSFYLENDNICVLVCVCVCDTDCSAAAGLGLSYSSITDQCEGGRRYIVVFKFLLKEDINCE